MRKIGSFDGSAFYGALDSQRVSKGLNWKDVAAQSGVSASTLTRMAQGKLPDVDGLAALIAWSGLDADDYILSEVSKPEPETLARITTYLRSDKNLSAPAVKALDEMIKAAYGQLRNPQK